MDPPSEMRIHALNTTTPNLADEHTLADGHPWEIKQRCLEYEYTQLGRWTYFEWWIPHSTPMPNGNFSLLLTSSDQEWQFDIATDI